MATRWDVRNSLRCSACVVLFGISLGMAQARAGEIPPGEAVHVSLDQATLIKLPDRVATIVVGNPLIADATLQTGGVAVLTGKGYGATNFIALDRKGNALLEKVIQVRGVKNAIVVYKGIFRETYSCAPGCQPMIVPGDFEPFFNQTLVQTTSRSTQATAVSAPR